MWSLTNRLARPPLAQHLAVTAGQLNGEARQALRDGEPGAERLRALIDAGAVCWRLWRPALSRRRWRAVKRSLDVQQRAVTSARPAPGRLIRTLQRQSAWLGELTAGPLPGDEVLLDGLTRLYRKARRAARAEPAAGRARRHLARLVLAEELLFPRTGPNRGVNGPAPAARRMLLAAMVKRSRVVGSQRRFRRRLERGLVRLLPAALGPRPDDYRRAVMWRAFMALAPEPTPVPARPGGAREPTIGAGP